MLDLRNAHVFNHQGMRIQRIHLPNTVHAPPYAVSTPLNTTRLMVGSSHTHTSAVWLRGSGSACYSTDEAVVTVSATGTVTAMGAGKAFVVITAGNLYSVQKYIVE